MKSLLVVRVSRTNRAGKPAPARFPRARGRESACELTPLPVARRWDIQCFPVFCDGSPSDFDPLIRQNPGDLVVAQRFLRVFSRDELANLGADGGRRLLPVLAREVAREEIAELEHAPR